MEEKIKLCVDEYAKLRNIKLVALKVNIPWQTVYWYLKKANISVTGDKSSYGSKVDRFAHKGESYIKNLIEGAEDQNELYFQPKIDFIIKGYGVEVKSAKLCEKNRRWAFSLKKQIKVADFFILLAFDKDTESVTHHLLIPREMIIDSMQTLSLPLKIKNSKWGDFLITKQGLKEFFDMIEPKKLKN